MGPAHSRRALMDHVKQMFEMADSCQFTCFSTFLPTGSVRSLKSVLAVDKFQASGDWHSDFGLGIEMGYGGPGQAPDIQAVGALMGVELLPDKAKDLVFFTFVVKNLSKAVRTKVEGQETLRDKMSIAVHRVLEFMPDSKTCVVSLSPATTHHSSSQLVPLVLCLNELSSGVMLDMWQWQQAKDISVRVANHVVLPPHVALHVPEVLRSLSLSPQGNPRGDVPGRQHQVRRDCVEVRGADRRPPLGS